MLTSVIVPCWNALDLTKVCLERVARLTKPDWELVVVDNGSRDGTARWLQGLRRRLGRSLRVLSNAENLGYPAAMNQGLRAARGELIVFGNADAAVTEGWLEAMQEALAERPRAGGVSPCANPSRGRGGLWSARPWYKDLAGLDRFAAAGRLRRGVPAFVESPGFVPGFWFLARRSALERVGGFDERFSPGGFEDWDLQWRLRQAGYRLGFAARAYVHHVWFGCARSNGLRQARLYGPRRLARLYEKQPGAAALRLEVRTWSA